MRVNIILNNVRWLLFLYFTDARLGSDLRNRNFSLYAEITTDIKTPRRHWESEDMKGHSVCLKKYLQITIQMFTTFRARLWGEKKPEGFQPPDQHLGPFQKMVPVEPHSDGRFLVESRSAKHKVFELFLRVPNEFPVSSFFQNKYQPKQIAYSLNHPQI